MTKKGNEKGKKEEWVDLTKMSCQTWVGEEVVTEGWT